MVEATINAETVGTPDERIEEWKDPMNFDDFEYSKKRLEGPEDVFYFPVDYERLEFLMNKHKKAAMELALLIGAVDKKTGVFNPNHEQDNTQDYMEWQIMEVVELVSTQGHSGMSFDYFINLLVPLLKHEPIIHLTGEDWEWADVSEMSGFPLWQNKRYSSIFKDGDGVSTWSGGRIFTDDNGDTWFSRGGRHYTDADSSSVLVEFPLLVQDLEREKVYLDPKGQDPIEEVMDIDISEAEDLTYEAIPVGDTWVEDALKDGDEFGSETWEDEK